MSMTKEQRRARELAIPYCTTHGCRNKPRMGQELCGNCLYNEELRRIEMTGLSSIQTRIAALADRETAELLDNMLDYILERLENR